MAPKSKKVDKTPEPAAEPDAKKAKTEAEAEKKEEKQEEPKFQEPDAPNDNRPALKQNIGFEAADTTLNVVPTVGGKVLANVTDGGMAWLLAGARANVAQKSGRYMFEAKVIQQTDPSYGQAKACKTTLRIGFSTSESGLLMDDRCAYFDSEGFFMGNKRKTSLKNSQFFGKDKVVAVVLNLDSKSPNFNTVALYRDGQAVGDPMPLPEDLKGKSLFPHIVYRNASVHVNFGATAIKELPFKCRLLQSAAASDVEVPPSKAPKDGKHEVIMPVAFPDEGTFDWLDGFLEKNPQYVELSDRKIHQWCHQSGIYGKGPGGKNNSNDKPLVSFGVPPLDDMSVRKIINTLSPIMPRNYIIMEVKSNLIASERQEILKRFNYSCYKKIAKVVMGEPSKDFKTSVQNKLLKDKQQRSDNVWKTKKVEEDRKRVQVKMRKEAEKKRKEVEAKKKADADAKKKKEEEEKKAKDGEKKDEEEEKKEEKEDAAMEEKPEEEEAEPEEDKNTEPPKVELTDEEKNINFIRRSTPDVAQNVMNACYSKFSTPEEDEGFDNIQYEWQKGKAANEYLKQWVMNKKLTTRIEDIRPGQEFTGKKTEFNKLSKEWQDKLKAYKNAGKKKPAKKADGEDGEDDIDIFSVTDVCDVGSGVPLFDSFVYEDWELMKLRFELCMLVLSFKKDCNDPDRTGIPMDHIGFYYQRYFGGHLDVKRFSAADMNELLTLVKDSVSTKDSLLVAQLSDDAVDSLDIFLKLTEEGRRERQRRIDAGDETARLKIAPLPEPKPVSKPPPQPATVSETKDTPAGKSVPPPNRVGKDAGKAVFERIFGKDAGKGKDIAKGKDEGKFGGGKDFGKASQWGGGGGGKDFGKAGGKDFKGGKDAKDQGKDQGKGFKAEKGGWGKGGGKGGKW